MNDIFPKMQDAVKQADPVRTEAVKAVIRENKVVVKNVYQEGLALQPEDIFVNKTVDLAELLGIRHCVFALRAAGDRRTSAPFTASSVARSRDWPWTRNEGVARGLTLGASSRAEADSNVRVRRR